jgi:hypothetical protein
MVSNMGARSPYVFFALESKASQVEASHVKASHVKTGGQVL